MKKHGGKQGQGKGNRGKYVNNFSMGDLKRDSTPLKNKALAGSKIHSELMKKNEPVGQDNPDRYEGERRNGVVVFEGEQQNKIPLILARLRKRADCSKF